MNKKQILTTTVVLAILGLLVYFQVQHWRRFDWARFRTVSHVDPLHITAAIGLIYVTYVLRALRWKVFLEPVRKASTWKIVPPTFIGFTGLALLAFQTLPPPANGIGFLAFARIHDLVISKAAKRALHKLKLNSHCISGVGTKRRPSWKQSAENLTTE
jgi:heme/copper-type cytochrome/quinol oxidase subunit 2